MPFAGAYNLFFVTSYFGVSCLDVGMSLQPSTIESTRGKCYD